MANDRVSALCWACGASIVLEKYYPSGGLGEQKARDRLASFYGEHVNCTAPDGGYVPDLGDKPLILIVPEALIDSDVEQARRAVARATAIDRRRHEVGALMTKTQDDSQGWTAVKAVVDLSTGEVAGYMADEITMLGCEAPGWLYPALTPDQKASGSASPEPPVRRAVFPAGNGYYVGVL